MKKLFTIISLVVAALAGVTSCDTDYVFPNPETIPEYMIKVPIVTAKATATNGYSMEGTITPLNEDNSEYSIDFKFDANGIELDKLTLEMEYCKRTILKDNAFQGPAVLDLKGKSYAMTVNDCEKDVKYTITASVIPCQEPVLGATATSSEGLVENADIDNVNRTIKFFFSSDKFDVSSVDVSITYNSRAELGENAFTKKTLDLSTPYKMKVGDAVEFHEYTISAQVLNLPVLIPYGQCKVIRVDGDAPLALSESTVKEEYMFDGTWVRKYNGQPDMKHYRIYWYMSKEEDIAAHGEFLIFDAGEPVILAQAALHPYNNYSDHDVIKYAIYAYKGSNDIAPDAFSEGSSDWVKVLEGDDTDQWQLARDVQENTALIGTEDDPLTITQIHPVLNDITIPNARYFAFVKVMNCYEFQPDYYAKILGWKPTNRYHYASFTELELWRYKKP